MGTVKIPYYVVRPNGRGYWLPTRRMKAAGFDNVPCGVDGPAAWTTANEWNERWQAVRTGREPPPKRSWPRGSLGEAFERFRRTETWRQKAPRTREDWDRGWKWIEPVFGDVAPATVTLEHLDAWYWTLLGRTTVREAFGAMKTWRALWQVAASFGYCHKDFDPSAKIRRRTPKSRSATWTEGETVRLVKHAWRMGYRGLACIVAVAYDTGLAPVDARSLKASQKRQDRQGTRFEIPRAKTGQAALATLSRRTERLMAAYLAGLGVELHDDAFVFRNRSGAPYSKDTLGDDFRKVRNALFPGDERKLMDMRRTAAVEALVGGADTGALAAKMANTIDDAKELQRTYLPVDLAAVRTADAARRLGRKRRRENESG
jgi:hypothetical protein